MKKIFKTFILVIVIISLLFAIAVAVDVFILDKAIINNIIGISEELEALTLNISKTFTPKEVQGKLETKEYLGSYDNSINMVADNTIINMPVPNYNIRNTYKDTIFEEDGSYYVTVFGNKTNRTKTEATGIEYKEHRIGKDNPVIIEVTMHDENISIYIQCFDEDTLSFYSTYDWENVKHSTAKYDLTLTDDALASRVEIPEGIVLKESYNYLNNEIMEIVTNNRNEYEGYKEFHTYNDMVFHYYRNVGYLNTNMLVEYARLKSLGYEAKLYGHDRGLTYIQYEGFTVVGSPVTKNSSLIYYIKE